MTASEYRRFTADPDIAREMRLSAVPLSAEQCRKLMADNQALLSGRRNEVDQIKQVNKKVDAVMVRVIRWVAVIVLGFIVLSAIGGMINDGSLLQWFLDFTAKR